jgi:hypothetical protein
MVPTGLDPLAPPGISPWRLLMSLRTGEVYRCVDERCGCVMEVTKGSALEAKEIGTPRCNCGQEMTRVPAGGRAER